MPMRVPPAPPLPERPDVPVPGRWPTAANLTLAVAFWPLLALVTVIAFRVAQHVSCTPADPSGCDLVRPPRAVGTVTGTLGLVAFFIGHVRFAGRARALYLGAWLLLLLGWMVAMAYAPRVPLGIQVLMPAAFAFLLAYSLARHGVGAPPEHGG